VRQKGLQSLIHISPGQDRTDVYTSEIVLTEVDRPIDASLNDLDSVALGEDSDSIL
jgi:hypothetical protein